VGMAKRGKEKESRETGRSLLESAGNSVQKSVVKPPRQPDPWRKKRHGEKGIQVNPSWREDGGKTARRAKITDVTREKSKKNNVN